MSKKKATVYNSYDGLYVQLVEADDEDESPICTLNCGFREEADRICEFVNEIIKEVEK